MFILPFVDDSFSGEDIKACLCFGDKLSVLVFFETDIFLFDGFLVGFVFVDRLGVDVGEALGAKQFADIFLGFFSNVHLGAAVELPWGGCLLGSFPVVGERVLGMGLFPAVMVDGLGLFLASGNVACHLGLVADVVVGR